MRRPPGRPLLSISRERLNSLALRAVQLRLVVGVGELLSCWLGLQAHDRVVRHGEHTACREGVQRMYETLDYITRGYGQQGDIEQLEELAEAEALLLRCQQLLGGSGEATEMYREINEYYKKHNMVD